MTQANRVATTPHGEEKSTGAGHGVACDLLALVLELEVAFGGLEVDGAEHDVEDDHDGDAERLADGESVAEVV